MTQMLDSIFDGSVYLLERSLDLRLARQNLIAANVANAETPGYRALDMNFQEVLRDMADKLDASRSGHTAPSGAAPVRVRLTAADTGSLGNDNNTVGLERELGKLSENGLMFKAQALFLSKKLALLRQAVASSQEG